MLRMRVTDDGGALYLALPGEFQDRLQLSGRAGNIQLLR
jgi:hypothetical protein